MKKRKRLNFTPSKRHRQARIAFGNGMAAFCADVQIVVTGVSKAVRALQDAVRAAQELGRAISADPGIRQEAKLQVLYYQSWQRNELTDTLDAAGIAHA